MSVKKQTPKHIGNMIGTEVILNNSFKTPDNYFGYGLKIRDKKEIESQ